MLKKRIDIFKLLTTFLNKNDFSTADLVMISKHLQVTYIKKGEILLHSGEIENHLYYLIEGIIGKYAHNDRGEEICISWAYDGQLFNESKSFYSRKPSTAFIKALDNLTLVSITYESYVHLTNIIPAALRFRCKAVEAEYANLIEKTELIRLKDKTKQYEWLCNYYSKIIVRVPQKDIASFLGITPVHLSRLKKKYFNPTTINITSSLKYEAVY